jgi:predicted DNA-binding protein (MmcQ/YjbR family)
VQTIAKALRGLVYEELPEAQESFYGGQRPMAMYRTTAGVCWIQPLKECCNIYFMRGAELTDSDLILEGTSNRFRYAKIRSLEDIEQFPVRAWLQESVALNETATSNAMNFEQVLKKLQKICLALPNTKETLTWGKPHFRVGEKIFCGCGEDQGGPRIGLKMEAYHSQVMMKLPGIEKAPYSRKGDGWVSIDPGVFDDWDEIEHLLVGSYRLIAPKRTVDLLDSRQQESKTSRRRKSAKQGK